MIQKKIYKLETKLRDYEIYKIIDDNRQSDIGWYHNKDHKYYKGQTFGNKFQIQRIVDGSNSFIPVIEGTIEQKKDRCIIDCTFRLNDVVKGFFYFAVLFLIIMFVVSIIYSIHMSSMKNLFIFLPMFALLLITFAMFSMFDLEIENDMKKIKEILIIDNVIKVK